MKAFRKKKEKSRGVVEVKAGLPAGVVRRVHQLGRESGNSDVVISCVMVVFAFVFLLRSTSVRNLATGGMVVI